MTCSRYNSRHDICLTSVTLAIVALPIAVASSALASGQPAGYAVVNSSYTAPAHLQSQGTASCPAGTVPLSGGA
jgi:hypothetical protein